MASVPLSRRRPCGQLAFNRKLAIRALVFFFLCSFLFFPREEKPRFPTCPEIQETKLKEMVFFAASLHNSMEILPLFLHQMLVLADLFQDNCFISIYESGSTDGTKEELRKFEAILRTKRIPNRVIIDAHPGWSRQKNVHRIEFLATIRNTLLEPLFLGHYDRIVFFNGKLFSDARPARY